MKKYKILKLTKEEINILKKLIAQGIIDIKIKQDNLDDLFVRTQLKEYQDLFNYITYIER